MLAFDYSKIDIFDATISSEEFMKRLIERGRQEKISSAAIKAARERIRTGQTIVLPRNR
jgi:hypothetical protein